MKFWVHPGYRESTYTVKCEVCKKQAEGRYPNPTMALEALERRLREVV